MLRGEPADAVAQDLAVDVDVLGRWVEQFVRGGRDRLGVPEPSDLHRRADRLLELVAHELRTPVSVVRGWLRILRERSGDGTATADPDTGGLLDELHVNVERLVRLIDDLLDTTSASLGRYRLVRERVDLAQLASEAAGDDDALAVTRGTPVVVRGDTDGLRRVVARLVAGARLGRTSAALVIRTDVVSSWGELAVTRTGEPMAFETVQALLEPFDVPEERYAPSLGLYLARAIVVAHGGHLGARGDDDGTSFWIRLPLDDGSD